MARSFFLLLSSSVSPSIDIPAVTVYGMVHYRREVPHEDPDRARSAQETGSALSSVAAGREPVTVIRPNKPLAVIISAEEYRNKALERSSCWNKTGSSKAVLTGGARRHKEEPSCFHAVSLRDAAPSCEEAPFSEIIMSASESSCPILRVYGKQRSSPWLRAGADRGID
jgi:hypothetical protein